MAASDEEREILSNWEKMMACCFPCGYVWFKEGCGSACCINFVLGCFLGVCCVNVCHACVFIKDPPKPLSPCDIIANHGRAAPDGGFSGVVVKEPGQL